MVGKTKFEISIDKIDEVLLEFFYEKNFRWDNNLESLTLTYPSFFFFTKLFFEF